MAITVQSGTGTTSASTSYSVPLPASVISGDLLLLLCDITSTTTCTSSGWTSIHSDTNANDNFHVLKKTAGGSESAPTVNIGSAVASCAMIVRVRDWDGTTGPDQITAQVSATTTASIDPASAGSVKIAMAHSDPTTAGTKTWGSSSTDLGEIYNGTSAYITAAYKLEDSAGAITITFAGGFVGNVGTVILSIAPAVSSTAHSQSVSDTLSLSDSVVTEEIEPAPAARLQIAFDDDTFETDPNWENLDDQVRIAEYSIDRGRAYELDRVDTGRATITIHDTEGLFDPTNPGSPYVNKIQPLKQARLSLYNPHTDTRYTRFRGFIESYEYEYDPSQLVNTVTITLVDLFELVAAVQMFPGYFGDRPTGSVSRADVFFEDTPDGDLHGMQIRVEDILSRPRELPDWLGGCEIPSSFHVVFSGNVSLHETIYAAGESAMTAIQDAVEAEFPSVGNVYCDRLGRLCVHGRYARFAPEETAAATVGWDFQDWKAGDGEAVAASPTDTAHIRAFSVSRDLDKIINTAFASPLTNLDDPNFEAQVVQDTVSDGLYGIRPWSAQNLLTKEGVTDGFVGELGRANLSGWKETKRFAQYYVDNYAEPQNRVTQVSFRSSSLAATGTAANWDLLCRCDLNDRITLTIDSPGGGGFTDAQYFVEGIHQEVSPGGSELDDVTLTLDLSPAEYYEDSPFAEP